jgi:hypothetical protein
MPGNFQRFDAALASAHFRRHDFYQSSSQCSKRERDPRPHAVAHQSEGVIGACWNVTLSNLRFIARTRISARCALGSMSTVEVQDLTSSGNATYRYWSATAKCVLAGTCASFGQFLQDAQSLSCFYWSCRRFGLYAVGYGSLAHLATLIRAFHPRTDHQSHCPLMIRHI